MPKGLETEEDRCTKANRDTVVVAAQVVRVQPHSEFSGDAPEVRTNWQVWLTLKTGFDKQAMEILDFETEEQARDFFGKHPDGQVLSGLDAVYPVRFRKIYDSGTAGIAEHFSIENTFFQWCCTCLIRAGVKDPNTDTSQKVLEWHEAENLDWFKTAFGDNWWVVAELEFCANHYPRSSLAFLSAQILYNYYVTKDYYSAGYLFREHELIRGGAEDLAGSTLKVRETAGRSGGKASSIAKQKRIEAFLCEIEKLGDLVQRMSESAILDQAFRNAVMHDDNLWKKGRGQKDQYEVILRSDKRYRGRYSQVFRRAN